MKNIAKYSNPVIGIVAIAGLSLSFYASAVNIMSSWQKDEYSHGYFIPFIAAFLAWHKLAEVKPALRPSWWGVAWLIIAAIMQLTARLSAFDTIAQYALILSLAGLSLAFWGRRATWAIAPALAYLIFAIPLPHLVEANLTARLQLLSSTLGVWPLDVLGFPVYQEGNIIDLGGYRLQVVEACSGLRYLFPLMSFGYLIAFLIKDRMWKRGALFLSTIPITIIMNSLRIAFIGVTVDLWGIKMAEGFLHMFEGLTVFLVCVVILLGEAWILMRIGTRGHFRYDYFTMAHGPYFSRKARKTTQIPAFAAFVCVTLIALLFSSGTIDERTEISPAHPPFASFPLTVGDWHGSLGNIEPDVLAALQLSDYWIADYRRSQDATPVNFYMAYYASQRMGAQTHSPSLCIPGGGWVIENSRVETIPLAQGNLNVTRILIRKGENAQIVYYWFDERGRDITESTVAKGYLLWDSITMHRTDGALVRLVTEIGKNENEAAAEQRLKDLLAAVYPEINGFVPGAAAR